MPALRAAPELSRSRLAPLILRRRAAYSSMGDVCLRNWRLETTGVMLWLIDGYNLMHAAGAIDKHVKSGRTFHRKRRRFLDVLAGALGADRAARTTIVFDAKKKPADFPVEATYQGMSIIFALGDENADARIEQLIAAALGPQVAHGGFHRPPRPPGGKPPQGQVAHFGRVS